MTKAQSNSNYFEAIDSSKNNAVTNLELLLAVFILKYYSSKENPLPASTIAERMSSITGCSHEQKTILRKLKNEYLSSDNKISSTISLILGGNVIEEASAKNTEKKHHRFYFKPFMDKSDLEMISGSIASNRYLTREETDYLITCERSLSPYRLSSDSTGIDVNGLNTDNAVLIPTLPHKPDVSSKGDNLKMLLHVNELYEAIRTESQIMLTYGYYDIDINKLRKLRFHRKEKVYILNPYFMLWNHGHYYLVATHKGHTNPAHFRISRIAAVSPVRDPLDAARAVKREQIPDCLKVFLVKTGRSREKFNSVKYSNTYPLMGIYNTDHLVDCCIECTSATLSILVDTFGTDIDVISSDLPHEPGEVDIHGKPVNYLIARVKQVQYDNILMFCLQQHESITVVYPPELVNDISTRLHASISRYDKINLTPPHNPFQTKKD